MRHSFMCYLRISLVCSRVAGVVRRPTRRALAVGSQLAVDTRQSSRFRSATFGIAYREITSRHTNHIVMRLMRATRLDPGSVVPKAKTRIGRLFKEVIRQSAPKLSRLCRPGKIAQYHQSVRCRLTSSAALVRRPINLSAREAVTPRRTDYKLIYRFLQTISRLRS
ncbi:unnamed protein product [Colias eurytheme]|nr:unnamed protein product [Colias eurytheme]